MAAPVPQDAASLAGWVKALDPDQAQIRVDVGSHFCHKAADWPYLRPRVPDAPESRAIHVAPKADWPL